MHNFEAKIVERSSTNHGLYRAIVESKQDTINYYYYSVGVLIVHAALAISGTAYGRMLPFSLESL
jgi:hypothetical protein